MSPLITLGPFIEHKFHYWSYFNNIAGFFIQKPLDIDFDLIYNGITLQTSHQARKKEAAAKVGLEKKGRP